MAKKRDIDPGLQYLRDINFQRIRGHYGLYDSWTRMFGKTKADQLFAQRGKIPDGSAEFYEFKNSDPDISRSISEAYDSEILRSACNYVYSQKEKFGRRILEVGCEAGYMTGFLARTFPEAHIVAIDRCEAAAKIAKSRLEPTGIDNVEFRACSLADVTEKFDTVFCIRTIQENLNYDDAPFNGDPLIYQFFCLCSTDRILYGFAHFVIKRKW